MTCKTLAQAAAPITRKLVDRFHSAKADHVLAQIRDGLAASDPAAIERAAGRLTEVARAWLQDHRSFPEAKP